MHSVNPIIIPRNHKVEEALTAANNGDLEVMNKLLASFKKTIRKSKILLIFSLLHRLVIKLIKHFVELNP